MNGKNTQDKLEQVNTEEEIEREKDRRSIELARMGRILPGHTPTQNPSGPR